MCNLYEPCGHEKVALKFDVDALIGDYAATIAPFKQGPIVVPGRAVVAQWGDDSSPFKDQNSDTPKRAAHVD